MSTTGACPTCSSMHVFYLVLADDDATEDDLGPLLSKLLRLGWAYRVQATEDNPNPPSFSCGSCGYGFNLDFTQTDLDQIYASVLNQQPITASQPAAAAAAAVSTSWRPLSPYSRLHLPRWMTTADWRRRSAGLTSTAAVLLRILTPQPWPALLPPPTTVAPYPIRSTRTTPWPATSTACKEAKKKKRSRK